MPALMLLLQSAPSTVADDISGHPYLAIVFVSFLFSILVALMKLFLSLFEKRINEKFEAVDVKFDGIEAHESRQDDRLDRIEDQLRKYDTHVAVGERESGEIHSSMARVEVALEKHIQREEAITWPKIDSLAEIVAVLATRVGQLEKKMPNGELQKLADAFTVLAAAKKVGVKR